MAETPHRLSPDTPLPDLIAYINQNFDLIDDQDRTKIINNAGIPQILFGYQKAGFGTLDYGLKVSKINPVTSQPYNVTTATNDQLAFNSAFNTLKIVSTDARSITTPINTASYGVVVPHGLSFTPAVFAMVFIVDKYQAAPLLQIDLASGVVTEYITVSVDDTNIYYRLYVPSSSPLYAAGITRSFKTYLLQETAN